VPESFAPIATKLGPITSPGAVVFRVGERAPMAIRLAAGTLAIDEGLPADAIVQVSLTDADFEPILVRGAELIDELGSGSGGARSGVAGSDGTSASANPDRQLAVLKALTLDRERIDLIRGVQGSVAFVLTADTAEHRVVLTPGTGTPNLAATECTVRCAISDFLAMQRGAANPFELMMNGKIQISGNAQIPMALSALLV
jgi:putative sterol carrier protein